MDTVAGSPPTVKARGLFGLRGILTAGSANACAASLNAPKAANLSATSHFAHLAENPSSKASSLA